MNYMYYIQRGENEMKKSIKSQRAEWLKKNNLTLREFARETDRYFTTVYAWFTTNRTPRKPYLDAVLDVYPDWPH
jgi:hypothetical protein